MGEQLKLNGKFFKFKWLKKKKKLTVIDSLDFCVTLCIHYNLKFIPPTPSPPPPPPPFTPKSGMNSII